MVYLIISIFILAAIIAFLEDRLSPITKYLIYLAIGIVLIFIAGLRDIGIDEDSENYASMYQHTYSISIFAGVEISFLLLSLLFNHITSDVHILFLFYAFWGVSLKLIAFRKLCNYIFIPLSIYICYYFNIHEMTQIRTGILSGLFLLSIPYIGDKKRGIALILICIGSFFHISGLILLPLVFLSNNAITGKWYFIWATLIPLSYILYWGGLAFVFTNDIPYIGDKLYTYQTAEERGFSIGGINLFGPFHILNILIFYFLLYFSNTITTYNKYFPIMIKIFGIGLFSFAALSFIPVLSQRISLLLRIVSIILYANITYVFKPRWCGILIVCLLALLCMNYGFKYIGFVLFWEV